MRKKSKSDWRLKVRRHKSGWGYTLHIDGALARRAGRFQSQAEAAYWAGRVATVESYARNCYRGIATDFGET